MKKLIYIVLLIYISVISSNKIRAQSKILINEFLIDPQPQSVEIFNSGTESADISDWVIDDSGGTTFYTIPKESIIFPNQCLVFSADFNLNKSSADTIKLINNSQQLIDSFSYKSSSSSGISYFRFPDGSNNWATGSANLGFYNSSTEQTCLFPTLTPTMTPSPTPLLPTGFAGQAPTLTENPTPFASPEPTAEAGPISYDNIYLSEVMVNPASGEKEWIEIYNNNDFSVSLNNWYVDDLENTGSTPKVFSLEINAKSYAVFDLGSSIFNNGGDSVRLLDFEKNIKDDFEYSKSEQGKTLGRTSLESDDFCLQEPSKNIANNSCTNSNPTPTPLRPTQSSGFAGQAPTAKIILSSTNYPTGIVLKNFDGGEVLGVTNKLADKLIINSPNNKSLINLLCFLAFFYSLLTIASILFRMKLSYGKNKNISSSSFYSS